MTTKVEGKVLVLERTFQAPRELVFAMFKEPKHLARWWGPKGWTLPVCTIDFRPGGVWHYCMRSADGRMESWGKAVYHEIVEPERIVYVDYFSDENGNEAEDMPETLIAMEFIERDGKTTIVNRAQYASAEALQKVLDMGMLAGITETWDRLESLLQDLAE
ncbi:SRPBCC domain-containing protein [Paenibacillus thalictri]|uniref:SRPBCC domain-containing protein n=2 Tax=Paenibacillus thalictri TaxID=2527873 RepID=A0A4Q9DDH2_9BACL|nr:SRPBCC domain-containing protein [Paenibacillus thalictri]